MAVVLESLQPGARGGPHRETGALQAQGPAMGSQLGAGEVGPTLPEGRQMALALPPPLQVRQALVEGRGRRSGRGQQQRQIADAAARLVGLAGNGGHPGPALLVAVAGSG